MTVEVTYEVGVHPEVGALCSLREAVGWDRDETDYPGAFDAYDTCVTALLSDGSLVGWCAALSDGVRHAFLIDVIVTPRWQRRGVGRAMVERATAALRERGIRIIHVDFTPEQEGFYRRCGFRPSPAGIRELGDRLEE